MSYVYIKNSNYYNYFNYNYHFLPPKKKIDILPFYRYSSILKYGSGSSVLF